jgi:hypothetical protein
MLAAAMLLAAPLAAQTITQTATTTQSTQEDARQGGLVIKGGLSYGNVTNSGVFPGEAKKRAGAALGLGIVTGAPVGIGIEGLYAQRGIIGSTRGGSRELDYIDVPIYLRLGITNPGIEPFVYAGPQISFELNCDANGEDCPSGRSKVTYAGAIGAGIRIVPLGGLSIEGRYLYGLSDLKLSTVSDSDSYKTRSFMILLGFGF